MVSHYFETHRGGIEIVAGRLVRELVALGNDVIWAAGDADPTPAIAGAETVPVPVWNGLEQHTGLPMPIPGTRGLRRLSAAADGVDAVIVHDGIYAMSLVALMLARRRRIPVIIVQHVAAVPFQHPLLRMAMALAMRCLVRPALAASDQCVFISETVRQHFSDLRYRRPPLVLFNGVETAIFHPADPCARAALRTKLGLVEARRAALFVGRFVAKKGLTAIEEAAKQRPDVDFLLAGRGPIDPNLWCLPNVRLLGSLPSAELADIYRAADVLILPSVGEGFPLVVQEALASGLGVITGRDTADADPAAAAFLHAIDVDVADPVATGRKLADALAAVPPFDASEASARGGFAAGRYCWSATGKRYEELLASLSALPSRLTPADLPVPVAT